MRRSVKRQNERSPQRACAGRKGCVDLDRITHAWRRVAGKRRSVAEADFVTERVNTWFLRFWHFGILLCTCACFSVFAHMLQVFYEHAQLFLRVRNYSTYFLQMERFFSLLHVHLKRCLLFYSCYLRFCAFLNIFLYMHRFFSVCAPSPRDFCACALFSSFSQLLHMFSAD